MNIAEKLTKVAENQQKVYESGMADGLKGVTHNGIRTDFHYGFSGWRLTDDLLKHLPPLKPTDAYYMFNETYGGETVNLKNADIDFSECTSFYRAFNDSCVEEIGILDARKAQYGTSAEDGLYQMFRAPSNRNAIRWIDKFMIAEETDRFNNSFQNVVSLEHCIFEGCIAKNGLILSSCSKLDKESLLSVIDCLKDYSESGTSYSVTLGTTNKNKLTTAEIAVATQKGWSIA